MKSKLGFAVAAGLLGLGLSMHPVHLLSQESQREEAGDRRADQIAANNANEPNMASALRHLQQAEEDLEKATPNKGGHREKALELTRQARTQVEEGIKYYREHAGERKH